MYVSRDELLAENANLCKYIERKEHLANVARLIDENSKLRRENDRLRELCEYLWEFAKTCGADHPFLRELGVEVSE